MNLANSLRPAVLTCLALLAGPFALAQEKSGAPVTPVARGSREFISIDFPGGPLSTLVAGLNADQAASLSIIRDAGLDPVLPAFTVREARVDSVVVALGSLLRTKGYILEPTGPNLAVLSRVPEHRGQAFASLPLDEKMRDGPFSWTVEEIIAAIQAGCEFANPDGKPSSLRFKYHPATKLLFAAGSEQEVDIAQRVFGSLPRMPNRPRVAPATAPK